MQGLSAFIYRPDAHCETDHVDISIRTKAMNSSIETERFSTEFLGLSARTCS